MGRVREVFTTPEMRRRSQPLHEYFIHAEYCEGPFYMGWHLYVDPVFDGVPVMQPFFGKSEAEYQDERWHRMAQYVESFLEAGQRPPQHAWLRGDGDVVRRVAECYGMIGIPQTNYEYFRRDTYMARAVGVARPQGFYVLAHDERLYDFELPEELLAREASRPVTAAYRYSFDTGDYSARPLAAVSGIDPAWVHAKQHFIEKWGRKDASERSA